MDNTSAAYTARASILDPFPLGKYRDGVSTNGRTRIVGGSARREITANEAISLQIGIGTAIECVGGTIWLTQENDTRDHCVPAGTTFCADRAGRAVLTAVDDRAVVIVHYADAFASGRIPGTVQVDSIERLTHAARKAQHAALADIARRVVAWFPSTMRRLGRCTGAAPLSRTERISKGATVVPCRTLDMWRL
jgi:hypothetical protein